MNTFKIILPLVIGFIMGVLVTFYSEKQGTFTLESEDIVGEGTFMMKGGKLQVEGVIIKLKEQDKGNLQGLHTAYWEEV